jgi:hypothetical protein
VIRETLWPPKTATTLAGEWAELGEESADVTRELTVAIGDALGWGSPEAERLQEALGT